jgi:hypothetical protein
MSKLIIAIAVIVGTNAFAARSVAAHKSAPLSSPGSYGVAGCGLGSLAFHDQRGPIQIVAATLNGTGVQTFGITSGTSNCNDGENLIKAYIDTNHDAIKTAAARGQGEVLVGLAKVYNCQDSASLTHALKANYKEVFKSNDLNSTKAGIDNVIKTTPDLKATCQA